MPTRTKRTKKMMGGAWYDSVWNGIKSVASPLNDALKATKIISTVGGLIPNAAAQTAARVAGQLGYGKRKRQRGGARKTRSVIKT